MPAPTLRTLAKSLGLSRTTVSEALRGSPCVKPETAQRIVEAARLAGYQPNPLAGAVMSELRRSRGSTFRGVLAAISFDEPDRPAHAASFFRGLTQGATERAEQLGFKVEPFNAGGPQGIPIPRLHHILQSRGIQGIIILPAWGDPDLSLLDWSCYAGVYTDYIIEHPALHSVSCDHYRSLISTLQKLMALGYKRPGLFLQKHHDERLQYRWQGAFLSFRENHPTLGTVPPLVRDEVERETFTAWFKKYKPDVVLGHHSEALGWMRAAGAKIPKTHGFVCLNTLRANTPCAALDQQPVLLGARAAEIVIAQLHRNERGIPHPCSHTTIPAKWVDGPTIREA
jgi:DNA-binding LacI/PurR family transcriptional regulator